MWLLLLAVDPASFGGLLEQEADRLLVGVECGKFLPYDMPV